MDFYDGLVNVEVGFKCIFGYVEKCGVVLVMELFNFRVDYCDYLCDYLVWGVELCQWLGLDNFGLFYDIYYMQIMEGDIIVIIGKYYVCFKYYYIVGVFGWNEIGDWQELNYLVICCVICDIGFKGYLVQEFMFVVFDFVVLLCEVICFCDV